MGFNARRVFAGLALAAIMVVCINAVTVDRTGTYTALGLSTDTKPTTYQSGSTFYETDTGNVYIYNGSAWSVKSGAGGGAIVTVADGPDTLTATGYSPVVVSTGFNAVAYYITVGSINTSVTVYLEARNTAGGWTNVDADGDSTVIESNGTWQIKSTEVAADDSTRLNWTAEAGGTDAELIVNSERWTQ